MKRLSITIVILLMVFAMACNKSSKEGSASNSGTTQSATATPQTSKVSTVPPANPTTATPLKVSESTTTAGVNPPHGQPNHRCDIAVGAPLNSPAGTGKTLPPTSQPNAPTQITTTPATTIPTTTASTAPGMNPPHGQPNHRCDIAVGAPLNSPAGTGKTLPPTSQQNTPIQITNTPATTTPTTSASTAPGMNPPHGQPNHRCDIKVGEPLNSPPGK